MCPADLQTSRVDGGIVGDLFADEPLTPNDSPPPNYDPPVHSLLGGGFTAKSQRGSN